MTTTALAAGRPTVRAAKIEQGESIVLDGRLDEAPWHRAEIGTHFIERRPNTGAKPPVETEFRVLHDRDAIYVGVVMRLLPGEVPRAFELQRDSQRIWSDDAITVKIDAELDRRTSVGFSVNAAGAQVDFIALDNSPTILREFDAVWQAATSVDSDRWTAEYRLPVAALGLSPSEEEKVIGIQVSRDHSRRLATDDWSPMPIQFGPASAVHYGDVRGIDGIGGGIPFALVPYGLLRRTDAPGAPRPGEAALGGDVHLRLGNIFTELTAFTDFAQVDLDDPAVNLDRFALFLPEKRPFFLSGLSIFDFGQQGTAQLFFPRRIGIDAAGREVPILGGFKMYGRAGPVGIGVLDVLTDRTDTATATNWSVVRARLNLGSAADVGFMATLAGDVPIDVQGALPFEPRWSFGADASARAFDEHLEIRGFWAVTATQGFAPDRTENMFGRVSLAWRGRNFSPDLTINYVGEEFDPAIGFVFRRDIVTTTGRLRWYQYPESLLGLHNWKIGTITALRRSSDFERDLGITAGLDAELNFRAGFNVYTQLAYGEDLVEQPFQLLGRFPIEARRYSGLTYQLFVNAGEANNPYGSMSYFGSSFFGGQRHTVNGTIGAFLGSMVRVSGVADLSFIDLPEYETFTTFTMKGALTLIPTTDLLADLVFQLNDVADSAVALARVRWRYQPGSDVFLVYREDIPLESARDNTRSLVLKLSYRFESAL